MPLVITEGNYLLAETPEWKDVRAQLDEVWFMDTPPAVRLARLVDRHVEFGMERPAAETWALGPDEANAALEGWQDFASGGDLFQRVLRLPGDAATRQVPASLSH